MRTFFLSTLLLPFLLQAQRTPKALLWRVQGPDQPRASYLLGTIHSRDARAFTHFAAVQAVMDSCDVVAGELDIDALASGDKSKMMGLLLPPGTDLDDLLSKGQYKRVRAALESKLGPMTGLFLRMKPFYLAAMLEELSQPKDSSAVLDQYLQQVARGRGKAVIGLERVEEQMAAADRIPLKDQARMLYETARHPTSKEWERVVTLYADQDLEGLADVLNKDESAKSFKTPLLSDRNGVMAQRMDSLMRDGRTYLFAVGAGHLPANDGVIAQLRAKGYRVEPVSVADKPKPVNVPR